MEIPFIRSFQNSFSVRERTIYIRPFHKQFFCIFRTSIQSVTQLGFNFNDIFQYTINVPHFVVIHQNILTNEDRSILCASISPFCFFVCSATLINCFLIGFNGVDRQLQQSLIYAFFVFVFFRATTFILSVCLV